MDTRWCTPNSKPLRPHQARWMQREQWSAITLQQPSHGRSAISCMDMPMEMASRQALIERCTLLQSRPAWHSSLHWSKLLHQKHRLHQGQGT